MPNYQYHVFCCSNHRESGKKACGDQGSEALRDYMKQRVKALDIPSTRINNAGCLNECERGPVLVIYPEGIWYAYKTRDDIDRIIDEHLLQGNVVEALRFNG